MGVHWESMWEYSRNLDRVSLRPLAFARAPGLRHRDIIGQTPPGPGAAVTARVTRKGRIAEACHDVQRPDRRRRARSPILAEGRVGASMARACGLSIYFPQAADHSAFYRELELASATGGRTSSRRCSATDGRPRVHGDGHCAVRANGRSASGQTTALAGTCAYCVLAKSMMVDRDS